MRPKSIVQFEYVYIGSMLLGILAAYLTADKNAAMMRNSGLPVSDATLIFGQWALSAIFVAIALLASRKASNVARWIIVVLAAFAVVSFPFSIPLLPLMGPVSILAVSQFVLAIVVIYLLFRRDAKAWFAGVRG
ncbi:hypothetical protein [Sphingomonas montana]|uniref:hypothetical protein n=1 Tax=Sphingomonas montana TaxID=1843236 RepID=UPI00096E0AD3|nr:hypothetical protein [Sphingomonas montana]